LFPQFRNPSFVIQGHDNKQPTPAPNPHVLSHYKGPTGQALRFCLDSKSHRTHTTPRDAMIVSPATHAPFHRFLFFGDAASFCKFASRYGQTYDYIEEIAYLKTGSLRALSNAAYEPRHDVRRRRRLARFSLPIRESILSWFWATPRPFRAKRFPSLRTKVCLSW